MQQKSGIKKMLCVLLSILMLVSVCPITASAYECVTFKAIDGTPGASSANGKENCDKLFDSDLNTKYHRKKHPEPCPVFRIIRFKLFLYTSYLALFAISNSL